MIYEIGAGFISAVKRLGLGIAGAGGAGARLAAIVQAILLVQLILRVEAILIVQTILVLLASLIGSGQRGSGNGHDERNDEEQKHKLFHRFIPFCDSGAVLSGERQTVPQTWFCLRDAKPAPQIRPSIKVPDQNGYCPRQFSAYRFGLVCV